MQLIYSPSRDDSSYSHKLSKLKQSKKAKRAPTEQSLSQPQNLHGASENDSIVSNTIRLRDKLSDVKKKQAESTLSSLISSATSERNRIKKKVSGLQQSHSQRSSQSLSTLLPKPSGSNKESTRNRSNSVDQVQEARRCSKKGEESQFLNETETRINPREFNHRQQLVSPELKKRLQGVSGVKSSPNSSEKEFSPQNPRQQKGHENANQVQEESHRHSKNVKESQLPKEIRNRRKSKEFNHHQNEEIKRKLQGAFGLQTSAISPEKIYSSRNYLHQQDTNNDSLSSSYPSSRAKSPQHLEHNTPTSSTRNRRDRFPRHHDSNNVPPPSHKEKCQNQHHSELGDTHPTQQSPYRPNEFKQNQRKENNKLKSLPSPRVDQHHQQNHHQHSPITSDRRGVGQHSTKKNPTPEDVYDEVLQNNHSGFNHDRHNIHRSTDNEPYNENYFSFTDQAGLTVKRSIAEDTLETTNSFIEDDDEGSTAQKTFPNSFAELPPVHTPAGPKEQLANSNNNDRRTGRLTPPIGHLSTSRSRKMVKREINSPPLPQNNNVKIGYLANSVSEISLSYSAEEVETSVRSNSRSHKKALVKEENLKLRGQVTMLQQKLNESLARVAKLEAQLQHFSANSKKSYSMKIDFVVDTSMREEDGGVQDVIARAVSRKF